MKQGGHRRAVAGFTIVEVMIVLAVSGLMLVSAIALFSGQTSRTEFQAGINDLHQQIQQVINGTVNGYYPNRGNFSCNGGASGFSPRFSSVSAGQGTNGGCIFVGKALQFGLMAPDGDASTLGVLPLVGNQYTNRKLITTLQQAVPRALYPTATEPKASAPPKTTVTTDLMQYGLTVASSNSVCAPIRTGVCYVPLKGGNPMTTGMAAFLSGDHNGTIAGVDTSGLTSGSQQFSLYGVTGSKPDEKFVEASDAIGNVPGSGSGGLGGLKPASSVSICIASTDTNQSGLFTISGNGSLSVSLQVKGGLTC